MRGSFHPLLRKKRSVGPLLKEEEEVASTVAFGLILLLSCIDSLLGMECIIFSPNAVPLLYYLTRDRDPVKAEFSFLPRKMHVFFPSFTRILSSSTLFSQSSSPSLYSSFFSSLQVTEPFICSEEIEEKKEDTMTKCLKFPSIQQLHCLSFHTI